MKLKVKIIGPKVHDVGYRYFLMSMAMANRIRRFEAHNIKGGEGGEVIAFADGDKEAINVFRGLIETNRPDHSEVSNIVFEDFDGEVMKIGEFAQFCTTVQLNKAIPLLLDMRDDLKAVRHTTGANLEEVRAVRKTSDMTLTEIKGLREDIQPGFAIQIQQIQADVRAIKERLGMP
jgi:acylphosphatase